MSAFPFLVSDLRHESGQCEDYKLTHSVNMQWLGMRVLRSLGYMIMTPQLDDPLITARERLTKAGNLLVDDELSMSTSLTSRR